MKQEGFTLVELSIVLVIIGLLIGGILVGQSLIDSTKVQSTIKQIQQLDAAVNLFKTKYKSLPGDNTKMPGVGRQGDNDGLVMWGGEVVFFWADLSAGIGLKNKFGVSYQQMPGWDLTSGLGAEGTYTPSFPVKRNVTHTPLLRTGTGGAAAGWDGTRNYFQYMMPGDAANAGWPSTDPMTPADTLALDSKLDDGKPYEGDFRAREYQTQTVQNRCASGMSYAPSEPGFYCSWELLFGAASGIARRN